jgi:hypothetical protein
VFSGGLGDRLACLYRRWAQFREPITINQSITSGKSSRVKISSPGDELAQSLRDTTGISPYITLKLLLFNNLKIFFKNR